MTIRSGIVVGRVTDGIGTGPLQGIDHEAEMATGTSAAGETIRGTVQIADVTGTILQKAAARIVLEHLWPIQRL